MEKYIQDLTVDEIVDYLRCKKECLIFNFFDREGVKNIFGVSTSKQEWNDFIKFCQRKDIDGVYNLTEILLEEWREEKGVFQ